MIRKALVAALLLTMVVTGVASGQSISALPGGGWWTSAGIQNVGSGTANVVLTAYPAAAADTTTYSASTTIPQDGSVTFLPGSTAAGTIDVSPSLPANFVGSMVLSSDQPLVAIGQVGNNQLSNPPLGTPGGYASEMYRGMSAGAATISFPTVKNNFGGKTSFFYVQATGSDVTVAATVKTNDGTSHTASYSIKANKSVLLSVGDFSPAIASTSCGDANTSPCVGSLSVTATGGNIVGVALETDTSVQPATRVQAASMFAPTDASANIYCPVFKNNYVNRYTGVTVQNTTGGALTVYATLTASAGGSGTYTANMSVPAGASRTFSAQIPNVGGFPDGAYGSMVITSTGNIIAAVNEANFNAAPFKATTYTCFADSAATQRIALPQVKENFGPNITGVSVQNVGSADTSITAKYTCAGTTYTANAVALAKGATFTYYNPSNPSNPGGVTWSGTALPNGSLCAVVVTANQNIVGIAQEAMPSGSLNTKNYEGFNLTAP
jgi:hypothetical protein